MPQFSSGRLCVGGDPWGAHHVGAAHPQAREPLRVGGLGRAHLSRALGGPFGGTFEGILRAHRMAADYIVRDSARSSIVAVEGPAVKQRLVQLMVRSEGNRSMTDWPPEAYVVSRRVGNASITIISEATFRGPVTLPIPETEWRRAIPEADVSGMISLGLNLAHVQFDKASILIDTGGIDDSSSGMAQQFATWFPSFTSSPGLHAGLAHLGISPEAITHVLITHAHSDHFAGVTTMRDGQAVACFPNARHLIAQRDWDPNQTQSNEALTRALGTIERLGLLEVTNGEHEVVPGITMLPAPGETPGHSVVRVRSAGQSFYYLGDLFHYACEAEHPDWMDPGRDPILMRRSRDRLMAEAVANRALLVFTHAPFPGWGRIVSTEQGYQWEWA